MARDNYYLMLGLDPPDRFATWEAIAPKLALKRNEWSQQSTTHPTRKNEFKQKLDELANIERVLKDDGLRKQEADEACNLFQAKRDEAKADLVAAFEFTASKKYLTPGDVKTLVGQGRGRWHEPDVLALAAERKVPIKDPAQKGPEAEIVDAVTVGAIQKNLVFLGKADLYEFLDAERTTSARALKNLTDRKYQEQRTLKKTPEVTAAQELLGHCSTLFGSEARRAVYDNTLAWLKLDEIRKVAEAVGTGEGKIAAEQTEKLILVGKKEGIAADDVVAAIKKLAAAKGWLVEVPAGGAVADPTQRCGNCRELAPLASTHCTRCGRPLKVECPQCKTLNPSDAKTCGKPGCSFSIGDMHQAERAIRDAKGLMQAEPDRALALLNTALTYWPGQPEAARLLDDLARRALKLDVYVNAVLTAIGDKLYSTAARTAVDELARQAPGHPRLASFRKQVADALAAADGLTRKARELEQQKKSDDAIDAYADALRVCADHPDARAGLSRCPPEPPSLPAVRATSAGVVVSWKPSPSRGRVTYRVTRKAGSQPTRPGDTDDLGLPSIPPFTDPKAEPGRPYYYAVFAERGGVPSARPAVVGPVVRVAEVTDLKATVGDGRVELGWNPPPNLRGVEVWRQPLVEPKAGAGTRVTAIIGATAADQGLTNGTPYGYRVVAVFPGLDGKPIASEGMTCMATPVAPPKAVTDLRAYRVAPGQFEATWTRPAAGDVRVYRIADPRANRPRTGQQLPADEVDRLGERVPAVNPGMVRGSLQQSSELHLLPVTVLGQVAVVGQLVTLNWVDDVDHLSARAEGGILRAQWEFPAGFEFAVVAFRPDKFPEGADDPLATAVPWTRDQSRLNGGFRSPIPASDKLFLAVYTAVNRDGQNRRQYSKGRRLEVAVGARRRVRYRVGRQKRYLVLANGLWELEVRAELATTLPELVLVGKADGYPRFPTDGEVVARGGLTELEPGRPTKVTFIPPAWFDIRNARLFPADDGQGGWLELIHDR